GTGFREQIRGRWNGADRQTQLLNSTTVRMSLNAADLMTAGIASIDMVNPSPGGGASNALSFTVAAVGQNLVPSISRVSTIVFNANGTRTVTIRGSGFVSGAQVRWNGANRSTSFVNSTTLRVTLSAADLAKSAAVAIFNPAPGGGLSNEIFYTMPRQRGPFVVK
ncbi:MAG TPA: IPT/TIG domain-containing protein, partial [Roseiflexaceae bacterium]|nr:IPT/TIG domain-containing protein [Roseiflexaceae bacterium]